MGFIGLIGLIGFIGFIGPMRFIGFRFKVATRVPCKGFWGFGELESCGPV